jgi:hypothetical protein
VVGRHWGCRRARILAAGCIIAAHVFGIEYGVVVLFLTCSMFRSDIEFYDNNIYIYDIIYIFVMIIKKKRKKKKGKKEKKKKTIYDNNIYD